MLAALQSGGLCREDWMPDHQFRPVHGAAAGQLLLPLPDRGGDRARARSPGFTWHETSSSTGPVALKVFKPDCPVTPSAALAEAARPRALNHPNLCTIYAVDDTAGVPIISMEYIPGHSLTEPARPSRPAGNLLSIARQMPPGMAAAHAAASSMVTSSQKM